MPILLSCGVCGKDFETFASEVRRGGGRFCSHGCRGRAVSMGLVEPSEKSCSVCGSRFAGTNGRRQCSLRCRFMSFVGPDWRWTGGGNGRYGQLWVDGRIVGAHVVSFFLHNGRWPAPGMFVLHKNDDPLCVDPGQLYEGTHLQNMADMTDRGRASRSGPGRPARGSANGSQLYPERLKRGERVHTAVLNEYAVRDIRSSYAAGETQVVLADRYGVGQTTISCIVRRRTWAHVV